MIRLHFDAADLRQITLAPEPNALWETALSVRGLRTGTASGGRARPAVDRWQRRMNGSLAARAGVLLDLVPRDGSMPDFLLQPSVGDFATALDLAGRTSAERLATDLRLEDSSGSSGTSGGWSREFAAGAAAARRTFTHDLRRYHASSIAPLWPRVRTDGLADRALRAEMLLRGGVDALLTTLSPSWLWDPPTLHLPSRSTYDIPLCGRGLLLMPSWFATGPLVMWRPEQSTVLVYPMHVSDRPDAPPGALGPLLGRTRAAVLAALRDPATTTALAERIGISLAAASQHATVLRNAGLVCTTRIGTAVLHSLTPLGQGLLEGEPHGRRQRASQAVVRSPSVGEAVDDGSAAPRTH
ncbi:winged helix-turn-helix domain-containing protein [Streptomyces sp. NPDC002133]|uniref:ArsR/SmtB family transcription factor n=1 Tax=Streptomyces sp. NPDC002133 TaxID=3154409 RepID=UPI00332EDCAB